MISVSVQNQDELSDIQRRIWDFPDGVARIVAISRWHWEMYDRLMAQGKLDDYSHEAYRIATNVVGKDDPDLEHFISVAVRDLLRCASDLAENSTAHNDNCILKDVKVASILHPHRSAKTDFNEAVMGLQCEPSLLI